MIDARNKLPLLSLSVKVPGKGNGIALWVRGANGAKVPAAVAVKTGFNGDWAVLEDFVKYSIPEQQHYSCESRPGFYSDSTKNVECNRALACECNIKYPSRKIVAIVGADSSVEYASRALSMMRDKVCVITVGRAQNYIQGDYYVGLEPLPQTAQAIKNTNNARTVAHLGIVAHPDFLGCNFKRVGWYHHGTFGSLPNLPRYWSGENVTFDAYQFAVKTLRAKTVLLFGMEHPIIKKDKELSLSYYWAGKALEALACHANSHGIKTYNALAPDATSTIYAGMRVGYFDEIFDEVGLRV